MFLHIGNNIIINQEEIIGIYNIKTLKNTEEYNKIIKNLEINNNLKKVENTEENTLILTEKNKKVQGFISNISSVTIAKRIEK